MAGAPSSEPCYSCIDVPLLEGRDGGPEAADWHVEDTRGGRTLNIQGGVRGKLLPAGWLNQAK